MIVETGAGEAKIRRQLGAFAVVAAALYVGRQAGEPVTDDYPGDSPHALTGGTPKLVSVNVSGEPYVDLERHAEIRVDAALKDRQPWKAAAEQDYGWLGEVITKHSHGDDADVKVRMPGILQASAGSTVDDYTAAAHTYLQRHHPPCLYVAGADKSLEEAAADDWTVISTKRGWSSVFTRPRPPGRAGGR